MARQPSKGRKCGLQRGDSIAERIADQLAQREHVTVCRGGGRAGQSADLLASHGMTAQAMDGGMQQWERDRLPITTPDGRPGTVA